MRFALDASRERAVFDLGRPLVELDVARAGTRALVVDADGLARMLDLETGDQLWSRKVDGSAAAFADDDRTVLLVFRSSLRAVDAETGAALRKSVRLAVPGVVEEIAPSADGATLIVIAGKPRARALALPSGVIVGRVKHERRVTAAAFAPSGRVVASTGVDRAARLWDRRTWREIRVLRGHVGQIQSVEFDQTGARVATSSTDQTARVWWVQTGASVAALFGHTSYVGDVSFGPAGVLVTASGDGTAWTWRRNGRPAHVLRGHRGAVTRAAYVSRDLVVTTGADGTLRLWDAGTRIELVPTDDEGPQLPRKRATSTVGDAEAVADGSLVRLRAEGQRVLRGHTDVVNAVAFSPDGKRLVTAGRDHDVVVWDVASGEEVHRLDEAQSASVEDARFSPDGRWIVTAGPISARVWNAADGRPLMYLYGPTAPLTAVGFESDSRAILAREAGGVVRRYECALCGGLDELMSLAETRLRGTGRALTAEERARFLG